MKKVLLMAIGLIAGTTIYAQDETTTESSSPSSSSSNRMFIGGTAGFFSEGFSHASDDSREVNTNSWVVGPTFAFMLSDKMGVGINLSVDGSTTKYENIDKDIEKMSGYSFQPFFRYYFAGTETLKFYGDLAVKIGGGKSTF